MWIKIKKTYLGNLGCFAAGHQYDLPESILQQLPKGSYEKTCAPWDVHKDERVVKLTELKSKAAEAEIFAEGECSKFDDIGKRLDELRKIEVNEKKEVDKAEQVWKQSAARTEKAIANAEKRPTEENNKKAAELNAKADELYIMRPRTRAFLKATQGKIMTLEAEADLKSIKGEELFKKMRKYKAEIEAIEKEIAAEKAKAKAKVGLMGIPPAVKADEPEKQSTQENQEQTDEGKTEEQTADEPPAEQPEGNDNSERQAAAAEQG